MILKELNLVNFGKISQERIKLEDGLNIIYGSNESGKTTIHNFIDGMFYGFLKPNVTRRYYFDEYEKYRPWNGNGYSGVLEFSKDGTTYRIERDFNEGEVSVYDNLTGRDITKDIDTGHKLKVHLPGIHFFDFNTTVYRNTISIKQLENRIDSDLSKEVKDRLANMSTSLDDNISVKKAISKLDRQLETIGTERAYTRPYGRAIEKLNALKDNRKDLLEKQSKYNECINESYILKKDIKKVENNINKLKIKLKKAGILDKKKTYEEGLKLKDEIKITNNKIEEYSKYSKLSYDEYTEALELKNDLKHLSTRIESLKENKKRIEDELNLIGKEDDSKTIEGIDVNDLSRDYFKYDELEDEKNNNIINSNENRFGILKSQLKDLVDKKSRFKTLGNISLLLTFACLGLGIVFIALAFLAIPLAGLTFYFKSRKKQYEEDIKEFYLNIKKIELKEKKRKEKIASAKVEQEEILLKYNCLSKAELKGLYNDSYMDIRDKSNKVNKIKKLEKQKEETITEIEEKEKKKLESEDKINKLIIKNGSDSLREFKEGLRKKRLYEDSIKDKENKTQVLDKVLGNYKLESLKDELIDFDVNSFSYIENIDKTYIDNQIKEKEEILFNINKENAKLEERINNLNKYVKNLVETEEEISKTIELIKSFEDKIESINLAKRTIENISENIHDEFAPVINKKISEIIYMVTDGKYDIIKIDDNLNISIENPITNKTIDIDSLSGGTVDQLYFALRFSIIGSISGESLPLILDDCFIQYDNSRLENILRILGNVANKKQILLFTCHHREKKILDDLGLNYNYINLT